MIDGIITHVPMEDRIGYFKNDKWARDIIKAVHAVNPYAIVYALDFYRESDDDYMVYAIFGLTQSYLDNIGKTLIPNYTFYDAHVKRFPFILMECKEVDVPSDYLNITRIEE